MVDRNIKLAIYPGLGLEEPFNPCHAYFDAIEMMNQPCGSIDPNGCAPSPETLSRLARECHDYQRRTEPADRDFPHYPY